MALDFDKIAAGINLGQVAAALQSPFRIGGFSVSGRQTSPVPKVDWSTAGKIVNSLKRVDRWMVKEAIIEAEQRGDEFNLMMFQVISEQVEKKRGRPKWGQSTSALSQSDLDHLHDYLFEWFDKPPVPRSVLRTL